MTRLQAVSPMFQEWATSMCAATLGLTAATTARARRPRLASLSTSFAGFLTCLTTIESMPTLALLNMSARGPRVRGLVGRAPCCGLRFTNSASACGGWYPDFCRGPDWAMLGWVARHIKTAGLSSTPQREDVACTVATA